MNRELDEIILEGAEQRGLMQHVGSVSLGLIGRNMVQNNATICRPGCKGAENCVR